jgi:hypothetical protein
MVIVKLAGGLGNQMFQYAAGRRLAMARGVELRLDTADYRTGADDRGPAFAAYRRPLRLYELGVTATTATAAEIAALADQYASSSTRDRLVRQLRRVRPGFLWPPSHVRERQFRFQPEVMDLPGTVYLQGFWQSWRYLDDVAAAIRAEFQPRDQAIVPYARRYVDQIRSETGGRPVVSLHVRRGDLAHATETLRDPSLVYGPPVGLDYLRAAAGRFDADASFLVFSDTPTDLDWCRQQLPTAGFDAGRLRYAEGHTDVQDMAVMSACDGHVIANSTFSWWAAWLNDRPGKRVVAPRRWGSTSAALPTDDLIPRVWEQM